MPEPEMTSGMYGPDITFAGVPRTTLEVLAEGGLDVVFAGAPFDGAAASWPPTRPAPAADPSPRSWRGATSSDAPTPLPGGDGSARATGRST